MKTKQLLIAAFALAIATSCSKDEAAVTTSQDFNPDVINFTATTTRVSVSTISNLVGSTDGFAVYATYTGTDTEEWLIEGDNNYIYSGGAWGWTDTDSAPEWPTTTDEYPVSFYAVFPSSGDMVTSLTPATTLTSDTSAPLTATVTIQEPDDQVDFLATYTQASTKPSDGKLSLSFDHVLSKVDFGVIVGSGKQVYLNEMNLNNLDESGSLNVKTMTWGLDTEAYTADYDISDYLSSDAYVSNSTDEDTATAITNTSNEYSLMLLPQSATKSDVGTWGEVDITTSQPEGTYIGVNYRAEIYSSDIDGYEDYIGYADASNHPSYDADTDSDYNGEPLFVKVGYPLSTSWSMTKNYTYNIKIGTEDATNGYLLDDVYYDEDGEPTDFEIDFDKEIGDPISDGYINFDITVGDWGSEDSETIL